MVTDFVLGITFSQDEGGPSKYLSLILRNYTTIILQILEVRDPAENSKVLTFGVPIR